jgi:hypothetical protein
MWKWKRLWDRTWKGMRWWWEQIEGRAKRKAHSHFSHWIKDSHCKWNELKGREIQGRKIESKRRDHLNYIEWSLYKDGERTVLTQTLKVFLTQQGSEDESWTKSEGDSEDCFGLTLRIMKTIQMKWWVRDCLWFHSSNIRSCNSSCHDHDCRLDSRLYWTPSYSEQKGKEGERWLFCQIKLLSSCLSSPLLSMTHYSWRARQGS